MDNTKAFRILDKCAKEIKRKAEEYGEELGKDYAEMGQFLERKPTEVCYDLMFKHVTVLKKISRDPLAFPNALLEHRVMDLINFSVILMNEVMKYKEVVGREKAQKSLEEKDV